jgi:hypothetical protein
LSNPKKNTANRTARSNYPPHDTPTPLQRPVAERQRGAGFHRPAWREKRANFRQRRVHPTPTTTSKKNRRERAEEQGYTGQRGRLTRRFSDTHARRTTYSPPLLPSARARANSTRDTDYHSAERIRVMASDPHQMDTTEEDSDSLVGSVSTPRSQTPTQGTRRNPIAVSSALQHFIAPPRERGRSNSPTKFPAVKKRPRVPTPPTRNTTTHDEPGQQAHDPPPSTDLEFNTVATDLAALRNMMQIVMADNQALKGQVSYLTSQITTLNANMGSMSAKITALSQTRANTGNPQTVNVMQGDGPIQTASKQTDKPQAKSKPTLKLSLGGKTPEMATNTQNPPGKNSTYAGAAASAPEAAGFTVVSNKKKKREALETAI